MGIQFGPKLPQSSSVLLTIDPGSTVGITNAYTNLISAPENFSLWPQTAVSVRTNAATAPDGTLTASIVTDTTASSQHTIQLNASITTAGKYTFSIFAKAGTLDTFDIIANTSNLSRRYNLTTGTTSASVGSGPDSSGMTPVGNGWYRCWFTSSMAVNELLIIYFISNGNFSYTGNGAASIQFWGAHASSGTTLSEYFAQSVISNTNKLNVLSNPLVNLNKNTTLTLTPTGQQEYTVPGTYSWVAPAGVTSVSVVCVGGGGGGRGNTSADAGGGGGGGLGWKNNISVTPGQSYNVVVGSGGVGSGNGGDSYFINPGIVAGLGGVGGAVSGTVAGGGYVGDGGGAGGLGGAPASYAGGGGGAAGYAGNGGSGLSDSGGGTGTTAATPSGGGGGGGTSGHGGGGGGGVGIYGQGSSAGQIVDSLAGNGFGGGGGSGGNAGSNTDGLTPFGGGNGGNFGGGGGGGADGFRPDATGGRGAVRLIWGTGRSFPSTNASDATTNTVSLEQTRSLESVVTNNNVNYESGYLSFAGTTSSFATVSNVPTSEYLTINAAVFVPVWTIPSGTFLSNADADGTTRYQLGLSNSSYLGQVGAIFRTRLGNLVVGFSRAAIASGWHILTATFDGTAARLYIDGSLVATASTTATVLENLNYNTLSLGAKLTGNVASEAISCRIGTMTILNQAYSATDAANYYASIRGRYGI